MTDIPPLVDLAREAQRVGVLASFVQLDRDNGHDDPRDLARAARLKSEVTHLIAAAQRALEDL